MKHYLTRRAIARKTAKPPSSGKDIRAPETTAGAFVARRYGVPPAIADLIARMAGIGLDREAA
jgi:hypothetical protein